MKLSIFTASLLALALCIATPTFADTSFGALREKTPDYSIPFPLICGGKKHSARLDATHLFGPDTDDKGRTTYAPTTDLYVIWWLDSKPMILEKRDGYATSAEARDINGDGIPELLVRYGVGGHTNGLLIYELKGCDIRLLPEADFSGDAAPPRISLKKINGYPVITEFDRNWEHDPVQDDPIETTYVWDGKTYVEHKHKSS